MARQKGNPQKAENRNGRNLFLWLVLVLGTIYLMHIGTGTINVSVAELGYSEFYRKLLQNPETEEIRSAVQYDEHIEGILSSGQRFKVNIPEQDPEMIRLIRLNVADFKINPPKTAIMNFIYAFFPTLLFIGLLWFIFYRSAVQGGGKLMSFGKSRARLSGSGAKKITFEDVAGVDEAKEELQEVIEFLKDPKKFQRLGGKMPKGVLLMGAPGTGKTLMAKALAGEAGVPFFSISGSDFVEMFVGVGASRVRDLFEQAKRSVRMSQKGCIIFIDEIDAVGRQRFAGIGGGHDEREQTLNALLVEMDGFDTQEGTLLVAATNRPDVLDPALLRAGRFDRQIVIDRPDINGREAILKVHARNVKLSKNVDFGKVAQQTPGFTGADLANIINEAAILAARRNRQSVEMSEMAEAIERVMAGPEKKSRVISKEEKFITAYHEAGHSILSLLVPEADQMQKVSILPRGMALGYTMNPPATDKHIYTKKKLMADITMALGGRVSEEIVFNELSTGAYSDLKLVTEKAKMMVTRYGMSKQLGSLTFGRPYEQVFLGRDLAEDRDYSEETARLIDQEVRKIVDECYATAKEVLLEHRDKLNLLANALIEKEVMTAEEAKKLLKMEGQKPQDAAQ